jgi:perosamine synthetase
MTSPFIKQIGIASAPNAEKIDVKLSMQSLFNPFRWRKGTAIAQLEAEFAKKFGGVGAVSFESGRVSLWAILKALGIGDGDEVIVQAFTCVVVPDAVIWTGATPIYVDVRDNFNADPEEIERAITPRTKAIVVQHTFGIAAEVDKVMAIARKQRVVVIEDCAHTVGGVYKKGLLGSWAPISFFSFGQEKAISSVRGGIVVTKDAQFAEKLRDTQSSLKFLSRRSIVRYLLHPILWSIVNPTYYLVLGKGLLFLAYRLRLTGFLVTPEELRAGKPPQFPAKLANAQAAAALSQLNRVERFNKKRTELAVYYHRHLGKILGIKTPEDFSSPLLRFPMRLGNSSGLREYARTRHTILGNWYNEPIYPKGTDLAKVCYKKEMYPNAERLSQEVINLPLNPTITTKEAARVVKIVTEYLKKNES